MEVLVMKYDLMRLHLKTLEKKMEEMTEELLCLLCQERCELQAVWELQIQDTINTRSS